MTFNWRSYIDALSAMFTECVERHLGECHNIAHAKAGGDGFVRPRGRSWLPRLSWTDGDCSYLPAADSKKEPKDIRLLLLLKLFDIFEGTHL